MPYVPMSSYKGSGVRCSVTPVSEKSGGGWYCLTCNKQFGNRASPPCGEEALANPNYDKPGMRTIINPPHIFNQ